MSHVVAQCMRTECVPLARIADRVAEQRKLPVIEAVGPSDDGFKIPSLKDLALQLLVQLIDRSTKYI